MALANVMRLSLLKGAHATVSGAAWREIRFARDDKGEGGAASWHLLVDDGNSRSLRFATLRSG